MCEASITVSGRENDAPTAGASVAQEPEKEKSAAGDLPRQWKAASGAADNFGDGRHRAGSGSARGSAMPSARPRELIARLPDMSHFAAEFYECCATMKASL